jgi:UDP-glucose 4-epimerase
MNKNNSPTTFLITGGAGFIGSHVAEALLSRGNRVLVVDNLSTGSVHNIAHLMGNPDFHFVRASIMDEVVVDRLASQASTIFHLAAAVGVMRIIHAPVATIETNVAGTEAVLRSALRYGCRVVFSSTSEVYGKGISVPFHEDDDVLLGPTYRNRWAYGAGKMLDEFLSFAYAKEYGLEVIIVRLFNTVGPRQTGRYGMVVPRFVAQALSREPITVYGDGTQSRCFCDVRDVVEALLALVFHPTAPGRVYNVGNTEQISIMGLAERVKSITNSQSIIIKVPYSEAYESGFEDMERRVPDIERIYDLVAWRPRFSLDETLRSVAEYCSLNEG